MADNLRLAAEPAVTTIPVVTVPARVTEVPTSVPVTQVAPVTQVTQSQVSGVAATLSQPGYIIQGPPGPPSSHVASPRVYYRDVSPDRVVYRDSSSISPALRSWVECLVDNRVDQAMRQLQDGNFALLLEQTRQDANTISHNTNLALQQSEEARRRLEAQVRSLNDGQSKLKAIVENLSGENDRQFCSSSQAKAEAVQSVERVVATVQELRRTMEQDGDVVSARLREHALAIDDLRRSTAEDVARLRAAAADLQRLSAEATSRQRQNGDELATTAASVAATRQELAELSRQLQGFDRKLSGWKSEVKVEVLEEVAGREISQMADTRIDLESRIERLKVDLATLGKMKSETENRFHHMEQDFATRLGDLESFCDNLRSEVFSATNARVETLDARSSEAQQSLSRRFDALQVGVHEDVESTRLDLKKLSAHVKRLEDQHSSIREEVASEVRCAIAGIPDYSHDEGPLRAEMAQKLSDLGARLNDLGSRLQQMELATRESLELRVSHVNAEAQQGVDQVRSEVYALRKLLKEEQSVVAALDEQLWLTDQRLGQRIDDAERAIHRERLSFEARPLRTPQTSGQTSPNGESKSPGGLAMARLAAEGFAALAHEEVDEPSGRRGSGPSGLSMARQAAEDLASRGARSRLSDRRF
ncbi:Uncharacterized protein SCF082_LOCUS48741 [Durusdinium trenchii]|uniref:Uncharacterized protein n=1 Tax=Durusdinium trenchii TaxID=1381693 RepID=A0ABP0RYD7_9DINO